MKLKTLIWPAIGIAAVGFSIWLLYKELRGISLDDVGHGLASIALHQWLLAAASALAAYVSLAGYDHVALMHLRRRIPFSFISVCSFTTYALAHNIGGSVLSGAVIRYRAYGSRGLSVQEVGVLVALCTVTFVLGVAVIAAALLLIQPSVFAGFTDILPIEASRATGLFILTIVLLYVFGSWLRFRPRRIAGFRLHYPRLPIVMRQLLVGPAELMAAAGIIYFALPELGNPGYFVVLGVFLVSFSAALISHAPGGLGVLEFVFLAGLPQMDQASVLAALLVFRLFYFLLPLVAALCVVILFERSQFGRS